MLRQDFHALPLVFICLISRTFGDLTGGIDYVVIDGLTIPFGSVIEVTGNCLPVPLTVADAAAFYSDIPAVLARINSAGARRALVDYAVARGDFAAAAANALCQSDVLVPVLELLELEDAVGDRWSRHNILAQLLRHKHPAAVERFRKDLDDWFTYTRFRDHSSPEVLAVLKRIVAGHLIDITGESFGVDADTWQKWLESQPEERFRP